MTLRIILGKGRRVRDPATGEALTKRPRDVPDTAFWRRRLADGDVVVEPPRPAQKPAPKPAAKLSRKPSSDAAPVSAKKDPA